MIYHIKESRAGLPPDQFEAHVAEVWRAVGGVLREYWQVLLRSRPSSPKPAQGGGQRC